MGNNKSFLLCNPVCLITGCFVVMNPDVLEIIYEKQGVEGGS